MDGDSSHGAQRFWTQADALLRKNTTFQKRNIKANIRLISFPLILCLMLLFLQNLVNKELQKPKNRCGCTCANGDGGGSCKQVCGIEHSTLLQAATCPLPSPPEWPVLLQLPALEYRAVRTDFPSQSGLPEESCRRAGSCPVSVLVTGGNRTFVEKLSANIFSGVFNVNASNIFDTLPYNDLGSESRTENVNFLEPAFFSDLPVYYIQRQCGENSSSSIPLQFGSATINQAARCVEGVHLWRNSSLEINEEIHKGYRKGNPEGKINEIASAYDFLNSDGKAFNVTVWYNSTYQNNTGGSPIALVRVPRSVNLVSNTYLQFVKGQGTSILVDFIKEMPKPETRIRFDLSSLLGTLFFTWVILQLFPVVLTSLVYEKEQNLRMMMKMHGLGDGPYWFISYAYFLLISSVYVLSFVIFGSLIGLKFFTLNGYSIQFVFYFLYINLQISFAFLLASLFSKVKTATVLSYLFVFGSGLLGGFLFQFFIEDDSFPSGWIIVMELFPGFSLYRGLYEFSQSSFMGDYTGTDGMRWGDLGGRSKGMREVLIIMLLEWIIVISAAFLLDQCSPFRYFFEKARLLFSAESRNLSSFKEPGGFSVLTVDAPVEKPDVAKEREKVEEIVREESIGHAVVCDEIKKVYKGRDGNPDHFAVRGLSLALPHGECFGMLGPNGAGKTSFINMMIGLTKPTGGRAFVQGFDIQTNMSNIYASMGVCPQHDFLWESLTGREHLLFYGRLKNLKGASLELAVESSLKSVNLFNGGVGDRQAGKYSGGMKRRLSVAISLIGNPKVVYMDEPSTGLDPASRNSLWNVIRRAKQDRAILLTTHSMEEAEVLCDRIGIFVKGSLQCLGNPKELKGRYGGSYVLTMTVGAGQEEEVVKMVKGLSPNAHRTYQISGTQKFEIPKKDVKVAQVFSAVDRAKSDIALHAWALADTTLEDVFIKVSRAADSLHALS